MFRGEDEMWVQITTDTFVPGSPVAGSLIRNS